MRAGQTGGAARNGGALLSGLLRCGQCGRQMVVGYSGNGGNVPRYLCQGGRVDRGSSACQTLGARRVDEAVSERLLEAVQPAGVRASLDAAPALATARLPRRDEFFIGHCHVQVYEGATALHAAAFAYDRETAGDLVARGAGVRARDRRGAEPLHAAVIGEPGTPNWNPARQRTVIDLLKRATG